MPLITQYFSLSFTYIYNCNDSVVTLVGELYTCHKNDWPL